MSPRRSYQELLQTIEWQKKSAEIKVRDGWRCRDCRAGEGSGLSLSVHHCIYIRGLLPWEYPEWLLLSLCQPCHERRQITEELLHQAIAGLLAHVPVDYIEKRGWELLGDIYHLEGKD